MLKIKRAVILMAILTGSIPVFALDAPEIIRRRDQNEHLELARVESRMRIISRSREIEKTITSLIEGDNALSEFTNPRDRGTKFLKRGEDLYLFFPEAEDIVRISGHMLNQGMMGSDYSYRDIMESERLTELYEFELLGEEEVDGRNAYIVEGTALPGADVSYYRRKSWIDAERFIGLKEELYARSGRLLKEYSVSEVKETGGRWYPVRAVMEDKLRRGSRTVFEVISIDFEVEIPEGSFSLENLRR